VVIFKAALGSRANEEAWGNQNKSDAQTEIWERKEWYHFYFFVVVNWINCER
jgi:hypothetical protein